MTTPAHTPGPWKVTVLGPLIGVFAYGVKVCQLGSLGNRDPAIKADAVLIAAAPDMLAALRSALAISLKPLSNKRPGDHHGDLMADLGEVVRHAIAKAEGGTP